MYRYNKHFQTFLYL